MAGLRIWNDPTARFRTGAFSLLFVTAWNSLAIAVLQRDGAEWRELDDHGEPVTVAGVERALTTGELLERAFPSPEAKGYERTPVSGSHFATRSRIGTSQRLTTPSSLTPRLACSTSRVSS